MRIDGRCHCGQVSFTAEIDPDRVFLCHCTDCQAMSGSAFRMIVQAPTESLRLTGTTKRYTKVADSGRRRVNVFCPECATPLYATAPEGAPMVNVRLGCVAQRRELVPAAQLWHRSALPWLDRIPAVTAVEQQ